jgi:hypothetical protein
LIITINFIATFVESYLLVSVGFIFLSFRGSRWTAPYVERFIALAVTIGVKTLLLYCLISAGMNLGLNWIDEAQSISASTRKDFLVGPAGLEPATLCLEGRCSIHLSYGPVYKRVYRSAHTGPPVLKS